MATPKFDRIAKEFMSRIGDNFETEFTIGAAMPEGEILSAADISAYVNKALFILFNSEWDRVEGDKQRFINIFPELVFPTPSAVNLTSGIYTIAANYLDFFVIVNGLTATNKFIKVWTPDKYAMVKGSVFDELVPTADEPVVIQINENKLNFFPTTLTTATLVYIKQPLNPTDGSFLTQNGTYDSPFNIQWNSKIAEIAEKLYKTDRQMEQ